MNTIVSSLGSRRFSYRALDGLEPVDGILKIAGANGFDDGYLVQIVARCDSGVFEFLLSKIRDDELEPDSFYNIVLVSGGQSCTCKDAVCRKRECKHAAMLRKIHAMGGFPSLSVPLETERSNSGRSSRTSRNDEAGQADRVPERQAIAAGNRVGDLVRVSSCGQDEGADERASGYGV